MTHTVRFEPWGVALECSPEHTLLDAARLAEIPIGAVCSGRGTCGKCQLRVLTDPAPAPEAVELATLPAGALANGYRLACMHPVDRDLVAEILPIMSHGKGDAPLLERPLDTGSFVTRHTITVERPNLDRPIDDARNLLAALSAAGAPATEVDYRVVQQAPATLRSAGWRVTATRRRHEVIALRPATDRPALGLAIDLGTTNLAVYLHSLADGALLGVFSAANPLASYGADILSRLIFANQHPDNGARLQRILVKSLNLLVEHAAQTAGAAANDVEEVTVVGNSGMQHLFLNLPPSQLIHAPYVSASSQPMTLKARDLGIHIAPGAYVYAPPLIGGFVGSDLLAVALATRLDLKPGVRLALDIGTNTELLLSVDGKLVSCSTASGPALEGAALRYGSVASAGVVDRVWIEEPHGGFAHRTIRNKPAVGICGSGIVDALATMARAGVINASGRVQSDHPDVIPSPDGEHRFVLVPAAATALGDDLTISQHDVRAIQLAKGAIHGGIATLLGEHGLKVTDLDELLVAGAFGNHIGVESAQAIGLYPPIPREKIRQIGNAAGAGSSLMLLSPRERAAAEELSAKIEYLELARQKRFTRLFAEGQRFPVN